MSRAAAAARWPSGHYIECAELVATVWLAARSKNCEQGFKLTHPVGGGTGMRLLVLKRHDNHAHRVIGASYDLAKGHFNEDVELIDVAVDFEVYDGAQCIQLTHPIGGGMDSAIDTLLLKNYTERVDRDLC